MSSETPDKPAKRAKATRPNGAPAPAARAASTPPAAPTLSRNARFAWYAGLLVLGLLVGTAGALVQAAWLPAGLILALLGTAGLFYGGMRATGNQIGVAAGGGGWLIAVILLSFGRPEGDGAFGGGVGELLFLFGGMAIAVMCTTLARLPRPTP
ncbi:DUF6113 family protein [Streptomyces venezuelae]|uniref:DUF6113 family protein n=1 Tax=Streptomyces venezuelae TaxID=54571 RepID=UPI00123D6A42|nr:DUF6113 family protein [Streptomyces venezuelae]QES13146.1 hypothetical protein DEJ45_12560 [Streptomyces venezuelae]